MIPKKIHYCWFGRQPLPQEVVKYMESWKKFLPECEIKEWNENNFDINMFEYTKEAYFAKKYAFVSDVARLWALVNEGGVYLDTDIIVLRPLDEYLWKQKAFVGFEHDVFVGTGVIAAESHNSLLEEFLLQYKTLRFFEDFKFDERTNVWRITDFFEKRGLVRNNTKQHVEDVLVCPQNYFCNKDWKSGVCYNDENSFMIHDFRSSWCDAPIFFIERVKKKIKMVLTIVLYRLKCRRNNVD